MSPGDLFVLADRRSTRGHRYEIAHVYVSLDIRLRSFALRVVGTLNLLPDSVVALESLDRFKAALHSALGEQLFAFP